MSVPSMVENAGNNSTAQNCFRITFSQNLASIPTLEAWDDNTFSSTVKEMFAGTAGNGNIPYLSAVATTNAAPSSAWEPAAATAGGAVINRLQGTTSYVNLSTGIPVASGTVRFNLSWQIGYDASVPSTNTMNGVLACRYAYSGSTPSLTWAYNDNGAGGTEGSPSWTTISSGSGGNRIVPADSTATSSNIVLTKPTSGVADAPTIWVQTS